MEDRRFPLRIVDGRRLPEEYRRALKPGALIVDEARHSGNVSEALLAGLAERAPQVRTARVTAADCFIPLGDAAELVLVSEAEIVEVATRLSRS